MPSVIDGWGWECRNVFLQGRQSIRPHRTTCGKAMIYTMNFDSGAALARLEVLKDGRHTR